MKNNKTKLIIAIVLAVVIAAVAVLAIVNCKPKSGIEEVEGKTNIRVSTYNGGLGKEWLEIAAKKFEEKYAETEFESGKKGVAVHVTDCENASILESQSLKDNVYFTELFDYYTWVNLGKVADITDVVTGSLNEKFGEDDTIENKLDKQFKDFMTAKDGKYYAIPFYDGFTGFVYDVDWFVEKGYFFKDGGGFTGDTTKLSAGPDGEKGTIDDGMPATYDEFAQLLERIRSDGGMPLLCGESNAMDYWIKLATSYWSNYEGKESMLKNWTLEGTFDMVTSVSGDIVTTQKYTIDNTDATTTAKSVKNLQKQPGKYYALKFIDDVLCDNPRNYTSMNYLNAQSALIQTGIGQTGANSYSMILDGIWWENEADLNDAFTTAATLDLNYDPTSGEYKQTRNFKMMPIPRAPGQSTENYKQTLYSDNQAFCFISSDTTGAKLDVAKLFLQFVHTDEQLSAFTAKTSITRCLNYEITDADIETMTCFGKYMVEMKKNSDIVYPYSDNDYYLRNSQQFIIGKWGWNSKINGIVNQNPFTTISKGTTADAYFKGLYDAH